jgi:anti-sigma B factor antagonist
LTIGDRSQDGSTPGLRKAAVLSVDTKNGTAIVQLAGELDLYNAPDVREALQEVSADAPERVVVDLSEVEFIDSTALGVLIEARSRFANREAFLLAGPGLETRRALEISGLDRHFAVHATVDEALGAEL